MKLFFISGLVIGSLAVNAQTLPEKVVRFYNDKQYDSIFSLFSVEMKAALPADKTTEFFSGLAAQAGLIKNTAFKNTAGGYQQYKTIFENGTLLMSISSNENGQINGFFIKPYKEEAAIPVPARNSTRMSLPFRGEWSVFWGGDTREQNYHVTYKPQKNAFDILMADSAGRTHLRSGEKNEDYYAFGQPVIAPCDGEVVQAVDGVRDNVPGEMNPAYMAGNSIIVKTANNEYLLLAHFKQFSIRVKQGNKVKKGQLLGLCGNSGNSSEPHIHFHIQNSDDLMNGTGIKCNFEKIIVNGTVKSDYSPVKGERIRNAD